MLHRKHSVLYDTKKNAQYSEKHRYIENQYTTNLKLFNLVLEIDNNHLIHSTHFILKKKKKTNRRQDNMTT